MKRMSDYRAMLEDEIKQIKLPVDNLPGLYQPIYYSMENGGKRLRPILLLMTCDAFGGNLDEARRAALGIEMYHNFTLVHDDVMDRSDLRRGKPTVCRKWDTDTAILSGDVMLTLANQYMTEVPDKALRGVIDEFNRMALGVYEGQQLDMEFEKADDVTIDKYLEMIRLKTSVLLGAACAIGARIAGADEKDCEVMFRFGESLGVAFQIQDDYLDVYGDATTFGKPLGGDINNGKKTFLTLKTLEAGGANAEALKSAMNLPVGDLRVRTVRNIMTAAEMPRVCRKAWDEWSGRAIKSLTETSLDKESTAALKSVVEKLIDRKK